MRSERGKTTLRCAIYTRVSTEHGLEQEFNSLDNQREASEAYVKSQAHEGWKLIRTHYDDGGYSGGSMERPALQKDLRREAQALKEVVADLSVRIFSGGPVQPEAGFVAHSADYRRPETVVLTDRVSMTSNLAVLQDIGDKKGPAKFLVAFGYAGWGPDQLEHEIEEHAWGIGIDDLRELS